MRTTCFWNNLHQECSKSKDWKDKIIISFGSNKTKQGSQNQLINTFSSLYHITSLPFIWFNAHTCRKSLKLPKGYSKAVNRRRPDNAMAKRTNNDLQNTTQKTKDQATGTPLTTRGGSERGSHV